MRKIILTIAEFVNFAWLAKQHEFTFDETPVKNGKKEVTAKECDLLELGFTNFK